MVKVKPHIIIDTTVRGEAGSKLTIEAKGYTGPKRKYIVYVTPLDLVEGARTRFILPTGKFSMSFNGGWEEINLSIEKGPRR